MKQRCRTSEHENTPGGWRAGTEHPIASAEREACLKETVPGHFSLPDRFRNIHSRFHCMSQFEVEFPEMYSSERSEHVPKTNANQELTDKERKKIERRSANSQRVMNRAAVASFSWRLQRSTTKCGIRNTSVDG